VTQSEKTTLTKQQSHPEKIRNAKEPAVLSVPHTDQFRTPNPKGIAVKMPLSGPAAGTEPGQPDRKRH